jgi:glycosyltransferase involved in cell wall biosynthesis
MGMKIAMICSYALSKKKVIGGIETHTDGLSRHLSKHDGIELYVITFGDGNKQFKKANLNIYVISKALYPFSIPAGALRLRKIIQKINPAIIHVQGTHFPYSVIAAFFQRKYLTVLTVHGIMAKEIEFRRRISILKNSVFLLFERYAVLKVQNIIAVSLHVKNVISDMTRSEIHVIPNGIDFEAIQNIQPRKSLVHVIPNGIDFEAIQNIQPRKSLVHPCILFIGELVKVKGVDLLIHAIPIIKKSFPNVRVLIGGAGPQAKELKNNVKELNVEETVEFLGFVSGDEKYSYYKSADLCVFPSLYETFGIVCLEAMASGKPVVASNVGGIPFVVEEGKTGLLFESGNIEDLAKKVITLLQDKELREKMGEAGRERAKEFTWNKIAEQTVEVYKGIIKC